MRLCSNKIWWPTLKFGFHLFLICYEIFFFIWFFSPNTYKWKNGSQFTDRAKNRRGFGPWGSFADPWSRAFIWTHVCLLLLTVSKLSSRSGIPRTQPSSRHSGRARRARVKWMHVWESEAIIPPSICWALIMVSGTLLSTLYAFSHLILI